LLRRNLAFGSLAVINTASAAVVALATIVLALAGFSYMSVAWATLAGAGTTTVLAFYFRPDLSILCPAFRSWSNVLRFGGYQGASHVINRTYEALPQLVLGHLLPHAAVGLYNRAVLVSDIPDKMLLASVSYVAFPALAAETRRGRSLKEPYLRALGYITVLFWPALVVLGILAYPAVLILLGDQWLTVVPLLQVMAIAGLAWFPVMLTGPVLMAVGANRDRVLAVLVTRAVAGITLCGAAYFGVMAMALSRLAILPFQMIVSLWFVRRRVAFLWRDLWAALWKSAVVTASSAAGPICVVALSDSGIEVGMAETAIAVVLAAAGWLAGVLAIRHPVLLELCQGIDALLATSLGQRFFGPRRRISGFIPKAGEAR
jgi:O-antigen/teichoic acid export membrane protein